MYFIVELLQSLSPNLRSTKQISFAFTVAYHLWDNWSYVLPLQSKLIADTLILERELIAGNENRPPCDRYLPKNNPLDWWVVSGPWTISVCECYARLLKWDFSASLLAEEVSKREVVLHLETSDFPANLWVREEQKERSSSSGTEWFLFLKILRETDFIFS